VLEEWCSRNVLQSLEKANSGTETENKEKKKAENGGGRDQEDREDPDNHQKET
jgi:hypothetical protein